MVKYNYNSITGRPYFTADDDEDYYDYRDVRFPPRPTEEAAFARLKQWERMRRYRDETSTAAR